VTVGHELDSESGLAEQEAPPPGIYSKDRLDEVRQFGRSILAYHAEFVRITSNGR